MNIEVYLIGILCLFDVLQKDLMGYFKYLNLEELSSAPREFQQLQNGWCEKNSEDMLFIVFGGFFPSYFGRILNAEGFSEDFCVAP